MSKLHTIEQDFQNYLLHQDPAIVHHVETSNRVPIEVRLGIYEHAYRARLHEALASTYPVLLEFMGEEAFELLCYAYIDAYPSSFRSIRWYGHALAEFLAHQQTAKPAACLAELALFEWTLSLVFDAADSPYLVEQDLYTIPPEAWATLRFSLHPSVHHLSLDWNVVHIWQSITHDKASPKPKKNKTSVDWQLWRKDRLTQFVSLSEDEAWGIKHIQKMSFEAFCLGLCQWIDEEQAGLHAASLLKGWIQGQMITRIDLSI